MSFEATVVEIFLSSPGDVTEEREVVLSNAAKWNRLRGRSCRCFISILTWEELVAPALAVRSQDVINAQIGNYYDVYLGIMWTRLGTPTGEADSGTVEEFDVALGRSREGRHVRIAALFKNGPVPVDQINVDQLQKVRDFKARIAAEGAFYREFSDISSLENILNLLFEQIARDKNHYSQDAEKSNIIPDHGSAGDSGLPVAKPILEDEEEGLLEVGEQFARISHELITKMSVIADSENRFTAELTDITDLIARITGSKNPDVSKIKITLLRAAQSMTSLSETYDELVEDVDILIKEVSRLANEDLRIRLEFIDPIDLAEDNLNSMLELVRVIDVGIVQLDNLIHVTSSLPRLSGEVNKAKNRLTRSRKRIRQSMAGLSESLSNSIAFFNTQSQMNS